MIRGSPLISAMTGIKYDAYEQLPGLAMMFFAPKVKVLEFSKIYRIKSPLKESHLMMIYVEKTAISREFSSKTWSG